MEAAVTRIAPDWSRRDVLVGTLHTAPQLEANLTHLFYHMPARLLACRPEAVGAVALYQSRRLFGAGAGGVHRWGLVERVELLPRAAITEIPKPRGGDERYLRFFVHSWATLDSPVRARGIAPGVSMLTTRHLLHSARYFPELYLQSERDHRLFTLLREAAERSRRLGKGVRLPSRGGEAVVVMGGDIGVYTADGCYEQYRLGEFYHNPYGFLRTISGVLGWDGGGNP